MHGLPYPDTPSRRVAAIGAVAAVHGGMAIALLSGFAGGIIKVIEQKYMPAWTYVDPPRPAPSLTPTAAPADSKRKAETRVDTAPTANLFLLPTGGFDPGLMPTGSFGGDTGPIIIPLPPRPMPTASFNSLDAQYEACVAYALSQRHEGWIVLPDRYDDGGFSGGNMQRPSMTRLMADVAAAAPGWAS